MSESKRGAVFALGSLALALVVVSQYVSGDNTIVDSLGGFIGWLRSLKQKAQNTVEQPDAMSLALQIIAEFESFKSHAYTDQGGKLTIGYGHLIVAGDGFSADSEITESDAWQLLKEDASSALDCVEAAVTADITPQQEAAMISLCYNIGCGRFQGSTLLKLFNQGDVNGALAEFGKWIYVNKVVSAGLVSRRSDEAQLFSQGVQA